jgi:hypothetical protein
MAQRIKVMQIIARMNVGGPAVIVAELMRGLDSSRFEQILITGYCDETEADYLDEVATDISGNSNCWAGKISFTYRRSQGVLWIGPHNQNACNLM